MSRFAGKTIIITGGARGQGAAEARALAAEGAHVVIGDIDAEAGAAVAREIGPRASYVRHDVTSEADWSAVVETAERHGGVHGLINNAGIYVLGSLATTTKAMFERHVAVNQTGCFLGMQAAAPAMERSGGGSIVNVSSVGGMRGSPAAIAYCATKWAMRGLTKAAALDLASKNIRVNSIHPGFVDTEMLHNRTPEQLKVMVEKVPMKRMAAASEVATMVLYLLSDESSFVTGAEFVIDGGGLL